MVGCNVSGNADCAPLFGTGQKLKRVQGSGRRRCIRVMNTTLPNKTFEASIFVGIKQA